MSKKQKPYEVPLEADLARDILMMPVPLSEVLTPPRTIGERVEQAKVAVDEANEFLAQSKAAKVIAVALMRDLKKRGHPAIVVRPDGIVILRVDYDGEIDPVQDTPVQKASRTSSLPKMDELREMAAELGVDISDLGRQRRAIHERLQETAS